MVTYKSIFIDTNREYEKGLLQQINVSDLSKMVNDVIRQSKGKERIKLLEIIYSLIYLSMRLDKDGSNSRCFLHINKRTYYIQLEKIKPFSRNIIHQFIHLLTNGYWEK